MIVLASEFYSTQSAIDYFYYVRLAEKVKGTLCAWIRDLAIVHSYNDNGDCTKWMHTRSISCACVPNLEQQLTAYSPVHSALEQILHWSLLGG